MSFINPQPTTSIRLNLRLLRRLLRNLLAKTIAGGVGWFKKNIPIIQLKLPFKNEQNQSVQTTNIFHPSFYKVV